MARKPPKSTASGGDTASSLPLSDPDDAVANPEEKLARIRREMEKQARKKRLLIQVAGTVAFLLISATGFLLWNYFRYRMTRQPFDSMYSQVDVRALQTYTPSEWRQIQELREQARRKGWFPTAGATCDLYREATKKLSAVLTTMDQVKQQYENLRKRFLERKQKAAENQLGKYLPAVWKQLQQIEKQAADPHTPGFSPHQAIEQLKRGLAILDQQSRQLGAIRAFNAARREYEQVQDKQVIQEWRIAAPQETTALQGLLARAKTAAAASQWDAARNAYVDAARMARKIKAKVGKARALALTAKETFEKHVQAADSARLKTNAAKAWARIEQLRKALQQAMSQYRYAEVVKLAKQADALLQSTIQAVQKAETERNQVLSQLDRSYQELARKQNILQKNWPKEWRKIQEAYGRIQQMNQQHHYLELVEKARVLMADIRALSKHAATIANDFQKVKKQFQQTFAALRPVLFERNLPDDWLAISDRISAARRAEKRQQLRQAVDAYTQAVALINAAKVKLGRLIADGNRLREETRRSLRSWRRGLTRFAPRRTARATALLRQAERVWRMHDYYTARDILAKARALLPKARFEALRNGTVIDYKNGLLWAADGKGPGGLHGRKLTWYEATREVYQLDFAGRRSWRLPSDDELQTLFDLPPEQFRKFFPNTPPTLYWTRAQLPDDVDHAICVDFASHEVQICPKTDKHLVRAVSTGR